MTLHYEDTQAEIHKVVVGPVDNNVFVLRCKSTGEAVLLDAANEHERLLELCRALDVRTVLETHGHWDHIQAVPAVREAGIDVGIAEGDHFLISAPYDFVIQDDDAYEVGDLRLHTIATPGHTPGSMCFLLEGSPVLFTGDTLFPGGPGATGFDHGNFDLIIRSIEDKLFRPLAPTTLVLPGHGVSTTIGREAPHLDEWVARGW
jgi:glyoxylase-like metal-dependent hydrolase (beta-lactamase superfamily II)